MIDDPLTRREVPAGSVIFREGEAGDRAYIIERGEVEISALRNGRKVFISRLGPGAIFGEMAFIGSTVRSATASAAEDCTLVTIGRDVLAKTMESADPMLQLLLKVALNRLRTTTRLLDLPALRRASPEADDADVDHLRKRALSRLSAEQDLNRALDRHELELFFQPIVTAENGRPAGFESLIRWRHPRRGLVRPVEFVGLAEETGAVLDIGRWALDRACRTIGELQRAANNHRLFVSVNFSALHVAEPELVAEIDAAVRRHDVAPSTLKLEVTESALMDDPDRVAEVLDQIAALGVQLALDDFGTGYSSLGYLHRYPFHVLKVDRSFVATMLDDVDSLALVRAIVRMAGELGLEVVAEGVETTNQLVTVQDLGCTYAQGYLISAPLSYRRALSWLRAG